MDKQEFKFDIKTVAFIAVVLLISGGVLLFFSKNSSKEPGRSQVAGTNKVVNDGFLGEKGEALEAVSGQIYVDEAKVADGNMYAFNYYSEKLGKAIYFFIVKASDGTYRAAANACEVCYGSKKGFKQVGDLIRCENCQTTYTKDSIALQKGGCNPGPISKDVMVDNGRLVLNVSDVEAVGYLF